MDLPRYRSREGARAYGRKYRWWRALSSRRELALVARALARTGTGGNLLDCPCGAGRLVPALRRRAARVTALDASAEMVRRARAAAGGDGFAVGSAFDLPFPAKSFDAAVCHRLLHHLPAGGRARVLAELARVARRVVVVSFGDAETAKASRQRGSRRHVLTRAELAAECAPHGLRPDGPVRRVWGWASVVAVAAFRVG